MSSSLSSPRHDGSPGQSNKSVRTPLSSPLDQPRHASLSIATFHEELLSGFEESLDLISRFESASISTRRNLREGESKSLSDLIREIHQIILNQKNLVLDQQKHLIQSPGSMIDGAEIVNTGKGSQLSGAQDIPFRSQEAPPTSDLDSNSYVTYTSIEKIKINDISLDVHTLATTRKAMELIETCTQTLKSSYAREEYEEADNLRRILEYVQGWYYPFQQAAADLFESVQAVEKVLRENERLEQNPSNKRRCEGIDVESLDIATAATKRQKQ